MEALVILVLQFLAVLFWPVLAVVGGLLAALAELVFELLGLVLWRARGRRRRARGADPDTGPRHDPAAARRIRQRLIWFLGVPVAVALVPVLVLNLWLFDPVARWASDRIAARTGIAIGFDRIDGDVFTGRLSVGGLRVARASATATSFDLTVAEAAVDVDVLSLFGGEVRLAALSVAGVGGRIATAADASGGDAPAGAGERPRRGFAVRDLRIADVALDIHPAGRAPLRLEIAAASSAPFRSRVAAFDLFFRSNLDARIDGVRLAVATEALSERSRRTAWRLDRAPVETIGALVGRAPATWFRDGTITVAVDDQWDLDEVTIDMDWRLTLAGVDVAAPDGSGVSGRAMARALDLFVASRPDPIELAFALSLDRDSLEVAGSGDLTALWDALRKGLQATIAADPPVGATDRPAPPTLRDRAKGLAGGVGALFGRETED